MSRTVYVHPGLPKSGTSYVQKALSANKAELRAAGLLFPGENWVQQVRAVKDVRGMPARPSMRRGVSGAWDRLVAEIAAWPHDAIVSMEWLAAASTEQIETIVGDLQPANVQVVFTVRDIGRTVPAAWQEFMQNREEWPWEDFLEGVVARERTSTHAGRRFWAQQDLAALLETWTRVVPTEDVHVVTVPHPGAGQDVLWHRLCEVIGTAYLECSLENARSNASLGLESAELMRRLNKVAREERLSPRVYMEELKHRIAKELLAGRSRDESRLALPEAYHEWAREEAARQIESVSRSGVHVVGELEDLRPVLSTPDRQPSDVTADEILDIALEVMVKMAGRLASHRHDRAVLRAENARLRERLRKFEARRPGSTIRLYARSARGRLARFRRRGAD